MTGRRGVIGMMDSSAMGLQQYFTANQALRKAERAYDQGNRKLAETLLEGILKSTCAYGELDQDSLFSALCLYIDTLDALEKKEELLRLRDELGSVMGRESDSVVALDHLHLLLARIKICLSLDEKFEARRMLTELDQMIDSLDEAPGLRIVAQVYRNSGENSKAFDILALLHEQGESLAIDELAELAVNLKRSEARRYLEECPVDMPTRSSLYLKLAKHLVYEADEYEEAAQCCVKALEHQSDGSLIHQACILLAKAVELGANYEYALNVLHRLSPSQSRRQLSRPPTVVQMCKRKRPLLIAIAHTAPLEIAARELQEALNGELKDDRELRWALAELLVTDDPARALGVLGVKDVMHMSLFAQLSTLGEFFVESLHFDTAQLCFDTASEYACENADFAQIEALKGLSELLAGRVDRAIQSLEIARSHEPSSEFVLLLEAELVVATNDYRLLQLAPVKDVSSLRNSRALASMARLAYHQQDFSLGLRISTRVLSISSRLTPEWRAATVIGCLCRRAMCLFSGFDESFASVEMVISWELENGLLPSISTALATRLPFADEMLRSIVVAQARGPQAALSSEGYSAHAPQPYDHSITRIGFITGFFDIVHVQTVTTLLELMNGSVTFEFYAFGCREPSNPTNKLSFQRLLRDRFVSLVGISPMRANGRIREREIDILISLDGLNSSHLDEVLALKPAPLIIGMFAHPEFASFPWIDGVISDHIISNELGDSLLMPEPLSMFIGTHAFDHEPYLHLRTWPPQQSLFSHFPQLPSRPQLGIPLDAVVLANFGELYLLDGLVVQTWIEILQSVPNSLLLLSNSPASAASRISEMADVAGVGNRLHFLDCSDRETVIARSLLVDLYLDSSRLKNPDTVLDMLWTGVPIVTYTGDTAQSRQTASILKAIDITDFIGTSIDEYKQIAIDAAMHIEELTDLRNQLLMRRRNCALFNIDRWLTEFGALIQKLSDRIS